MTDRELLQDALDALTYVGDKDIYSGTIDALRARLATCDRCGKVNPAELHTCTPPQREWVGLTYGEREQIEIKANDMSEMTVWEYARRVGNFTEAKLREKNT